MAPVQVGSETMQCCSSSVLTHLFLLPLTELPTAPTVSPCLFVNVTTSGMLPSFLVGFQETCQRTPRVQKCRVKGTLVLAVVHWCALWPPSSPPFPCHVINQTSGCQNAREHFYPVMPTYSLILSTHIKSLCLLDILFLAETSQPYSRGK